MSRVYKNIPKKVKLYNQNFDLYVGNIFSKTKFDSSREGERSDAFRQAKIDYKKVYLKLIPLKEANFFGDKYYWVIYVRDKKYK